MKRHPSQQTPLPALAAALGVLAFCPTALHAQTVTPLTITSGFNVGVIADGSSDAQFSTTDTVDYNYDFYDSSFDADHTGSPGGDFPAGETITGAATGNPYTLASATGNNALDLKSGDFTSGILDLSPISGVETLYILGTGGDGGGNIDYTLNFTGGATQTGTISFPDWYGPNYYGTSAEVTGLGLVFRSQNTYLGSAVFDLYSAPIAVDLSDQTLTLDSIDLTYGGSGEEAVFAVSGAVVTSSVPEPSSYWLLALGASALLIASRQSLSKNMVRRERL